MLIPCATCNGDGFVSFGDRHVENRKEVCSECKGFCKVDARTGEVPQASASPDGTSLYADRPAEPRWRWVFGRHSGYDCMFGGYDLYELGELRLTVDCSNMPGFVDEGGRANDPNPSGEALAERLVASLNAVSYATDEPPPVAETLDTIAQWCEETFGPITPERMVERAGEEFEELRAEPSSAEEAADVVICLSRVPGLWEAVLRKMAKNRLRRWNLRGDGTGYHIKE